MKLSDSPVRTVMGPIIGYIYLWLDMFSYVAQQNKTAPVDSVFVVQVYASLFLNNNCPCNIHRNTLVAFCHGLNQPHQIMLLDIVKCSLLRI